MAVTNILVLILNYQYFSILGLLTDARANTFAPIK